MKVDREYDASADFNNLKTYDWFPGLKVNLQRGSVSDDVVDLRIRRAVEEEERDNPKGKCAG